jgi:hypothetical protein
MMKRKHKRILDKVVGIVKTIIISITVLVGLLVLIKTAKSGEFSLRLITNTLSLNQMGKNDTLYVVGDNTVSYSKLLRTKQIIETNFGLNVKISERINLESDLFENGYLNGDKTLYRFEDKNDKVIITEHSCISGGVLICGLSEGRFGNTALVGNTSSFNKSRLFEETLIHEISHNFGLQHCDNQNCLMFFMASHFGNHDMCDNCKEKLLKKLD